MRQSRDPAILAGALLLLGTAVAGAIGSSSWIGRPFPGFLVLENRVIASAGLSSWPATRGGEIYQSEVVAIDGRAIEHAQEIDARAAELPVGSPVVYRLKRGARERETTIETRRFTATDYALLFGTLLFCGISLGVLALGIRHLRGSDRVASGTAICLGIVAVWALTAVDLYGPYRFFRLHALAECFLFAGTLHMAMVFPHPSRAVERRP